MNPEKKTARVYHDKNGKKRYHGTRHLKGTQHLVRIIFVSEACYFFTCPTVLNMVTLHCNAVSAQVLPSALCPESCSPGSTPLG